VSALNVDETGIEGSEGLYRRKLDGDIGPDPGDNWQAESSNSYQPVEAVIKALSILRFVSTLRIASIADLHAVTGIAKPTIVRMLETLMHAGYVAKDRTFGGYRVTSEVQSLSSGFFGVPMVIEAAHSHALALTQRVKWAVGIGMLEGTYMRLQFTTASSSPWSLPLTSLNMRLDLVASAMGRAYLAFCPEHEREALITSLLTSIKDPEERDFRRGYIEVLLKTARRDGYALRERYGPNGNNQTLAVPVRHGDRVLASMAVGYFWNTVPVKEVRERIYEPLRETVDRVEKVIRHMSADPVR
jgi:IclR family transcriptional regulator, mhp operon transcriptional activator